MEVNVGLWSSLMRAFKPVRIDDPIFGSLRFRPDRKYPQYSYWEGIWRPSWQDGDAELQVVAGEGGPSEWQRERWRYFLDHAESFRNELERELFEDYQRWQKIVSEYPTPRNSSFPSINDRSGVWKHSHTALVRIMSAAQARATDYRAADYEVYLALDVDWEEEHGRGVGSGMGKAIEFWDE